MKINYKKLIINILIPLMLGGIVGFLSVSKNKLDSIIPAWIFPIVWTILYILMGISTYIIQEKGKKVPKIYYIQLVFNLLWVFVFFTFRLYLLAFIWIIILIIMVVIMIKRFSKIDKISGYLQIPYLLWLMVASILNLMYII